MKNFYPSYFFFYSIIIISSCTKKSIEQEISDAKIIERESVTNLSTLAPQAILGKAIYFDPYFSNPQLQSCASCHIPTAGWAGLKVAPIGGVTQGFISGIAEGAFRGRFGGRIPPSAAYATQSPTLQLIPGEDGEFRGGLFWDGRATGLSGKGSPAAEQAQGPLISSAEHNLADAKTVLEKIKNSTYYSTLWSNAYGNTPLSTSSSSDIAANFKRVGEAIAAYEESREVNQFSSKYDAVLRGEASLTIQERRGLNLFNNDAKCFRCHSSSGNPNTPPLFTDYKYYNLGLAKNLQNPIYLTNPGFVDNGLGGFLASQTLNQQWRPLAIRNRGKFKTPTLRNITMNPNRAYMHNGIFSSLEEVIDFYNTRDDSKARSRWGRPEVADNIQKGWLGNLNLTEQNKQDLISFLKTLNDGWSSPNSISNN